VPIWIEREVDEMSEKRYMVPNISCGHCVATIEREVGAVAGVERVTADADSKWVTVTCENESCFAEVERVLREIGYPPES